MEWTTPRRPMFWHHGRTEKDLARVGVLGVESVARGTCPGLVAGAPGAQGQPGQVPHYMVDAASCLVLGAQQRFGERAGGPVLNRLLNQSLPLFHSLFPFSILLLPEQISISSSPSLSFLHPQPVIPSPAPFLPTIRFSSREKEGRRRFRFWATPTSSPAIKRIRAGLRAPAAPPPPPTFLEFL